MSCHGTKIESLGFGGKNEMPKSITRQTVADTQHLVKLAQAVLLELNGALAQWKSPNREAGLLLGWLGHSRRVISWMA